jgi:hypothetical protein
MAKPCERTGFDAAAGYSVMRRPGYFGARPHRWQVVPDRSLLVLFDRFRRLLMFAQIIRGKVSDPVAVRPVVDRWMTELGPTAKGWLGSTSGITDDGQLFIMVRFESEEAARANSERPEQDQFWSETSKLFDGEPTFQDSNDVQVDTSGDPDAAGFVQVMTGQVTDPDRSKQLMAQMPDMRALRPDILGSVSVGHEDGKWTMVIYFSSEAEAREGEKKEIPPEMAATMEEMQSLSVGQPEFLDLKTPWLDSPK